MTIQLTIQMTIQLTIYIVKWQYNWLSYTFRRRHVHSTAAVTTTPSPRVATGNLYFRNLRIEFGLCTNFQHDWSIFKFSMTSWPPPRAIPKLVSVPIFSLIRTFLNFRWHRRPRPSGQTDRQTDRQMLFDYFRHPWQMHPRNSPTLRVIVLRRVTSSLGLTNDDEFLSRK